MGKKERRRGERQDYYNGRNIKVDVYLTLLRSHEKMIMETYFARGKNMFSQYD